MKTEEKMTYQEFIDYRLQQRNFIHDFSLGALLTYHKLVELYEHDKVVFDKDFIFLEKSKSNHLFIYNQQNVSIVSLLERFRILDKKLQISCASPIISLSKHKKYEEVFYQVGELEPSYHSFNKPISIFEKRPDLNIILEDLAGQAGLKELHNDWVQYKLSLPKTHRISFPTARYRNTLEELPIPTYKKAIYIKGNLYGFIVFSLENGVAFELSFCSLYWKPEFKILNGLNQYIFAYCVIQLQKQAIRFVNSGFALNKNLKVFKQCALKADKVYRYVYEI